MYFVDQSAPFEALIEMGTAGLVGSLEVAIIDNDNVVVSGPTALGIIENFVNGQPTGYYTAELTAPATLGQFSIVWSPDGSFNADTNVTDELKTGVAGAGTALPPISPLGPGPGPIAGPCNAWTTTEAVLDCCDAEDVGTFDSLYDDAVDSASRLLFELSGRLYSGTCDDTVRPCQTQCGCFGQVLSRGHLVGWDGCSWGTSYCGCSPLSKVKLSGYPVKDIIEVKVDGVVVSPTTYRLDEWRYLVRVRANDTDDPLFWPACQNLDLPDTENGTWSVRYAYGQNPPNIGQTAAAQLACEIYKSCTGADCALPSGATRITRQGITIERNSFSRDMDGTWRTGIQSVDLFLNAMNPSGLSRRPAIYSPDGPKFARRVGT